jgi:CRISPR-associated protein Cmr2
MDKDAIIKKIQTLLHDPPEKALILGKVGHENRALELMKIIENTALVTDETKDADHIASASDRINFPKDIEAEVDFSKKPVIIHPLSGKEFKMPASATSAITGIDYKQVMPTVEDAVKDIASRYTDLELRYLSLWAELQEIIKSKEYGQSSLRQLWELLPADTRVPDHSIWEHRRVASAIAGALPKPALLLFSIGPIQDFIATARKTQDLWSGSYMLSYLSWVAMKSISENVGPDSIIFPDLIGQPFCKKWLKEKGLMSIEDPEKDALSSPTLPNRILAVLSENGVEEIAERAKTEVDAGFKKICMSVKEGIENNIVELKGDTKWNEIWNRQTKNLIEVYWAILPMGKKEEYKKFIETYKSFLGDELLKDFEKLLNEYESKGFGPNTGTMYGQFYRFLEKGFGSRKITRNFLQQSEPHYKCTMCGVREPVHPEKHNNRSCEEYGALVGFWRERIREKFPDIKHSERLCSVCVAKRFAAKFYFNDKKGFDINASYPSTSTMATSSFKLRIIENMNKPELATKVGNYLTVVETLLGEERIRLYDAVPMVRRACRDDVASRFSKIDGDWLYEDTFRESLKDELPGYSEEILKSCISALKSLTDTTKDMELGMPSKYYAILHMDGDNMGKWVSGENAPKIKDILHPEVREQLLKDNNWSTLLEQNRPLNPALHIATSKALRDFSLRVVREIVERDHLGKLIYAGGDDVLAFVSLKDLPRVMRALRAYFSGSFVYDEEGGVKVDFQNGSGFIPVDEEGPLSLTTSKKPTGFLYSMGSTATVSMGVAIVHHSYDLSRAL